MVQHMGACILKYRTKMRVNWIGVKRREEMSKLKKIVIVAVIIVLLGGVSALVYNYISENRLTEKQRLIKGYEKLANDSSAVNSSIDMEELCESINSKQGTVSMQGKIESFPGAEKCEGIDVEIKSSHDISKKKAEVLYGVNYCGTKVASADLYVEKNTIYAAIPVLFSDVLKIDLSKIEKAKDSSYLLKDIPDEVWNSIDFSMLEDIWKDYEAKDKDDIESKAVIVKDFIDTYPDDADIIKNGVKVKADKNGNLVLSISGSAMKVLINDCATFIFDCDKYEETVDKLLDSVNKELDEDQKMTKKQLKYNFSSAATTISAFFSDGLKLVTTLNDDNEIVKTTFNYEYSIMNVDIAVDYEMNYTGKKTPYDKRKGSLKLTVGDKSIDMTITGNNTVKGGVTTSKSDVEINVMDEESITVNKKTSYNKDNGKYTYKLDADVAGEDISVTMNGKFSDVKKGKSFRFDMKKCVFETDGDKYEFSGSFSMSDKAESIKKPKTGDEKDLLKMKKKEFDKLAEEIDNNVYALQENGFDEE